MTPVLRTERLDFLPYRPEHEDHFVALLRDAEVCRWMGQDLVPEPQLRELFRAILTDVYPQGRFDVWGLWAAGAYVGHAEVKPTGNVDGHELVTALAPGFWGRGLGGEAVRGLLRHAADNLGLTEAYGMVGAENAASLAMCRRLGFRHVRDVVADDGSVTKLLVIPTKDPEAPREPGTASPPHTARAATEPGTVSADRTDRAAREPGTANPPHTARAATEPGTVSADRTDRAAREPGTASPPHTARAATDAEASDSAGVSGAGMSDAGAPDCAGMSDAGAPDCAGMSDAGAPDSAGMSHAGVPGAAGADADVKGIPGAAWAGSASDTARAAAVAHGAGPVADGAGAVEGSV